MSTVSNRVPQTAPLSPVNTHRSSQGDLTKIKEKILTGKMNIQQIFQRKAKKDAESKFFITKERALEGEMKTAKIEVRTERLDKEKSYLSPVSFLKKENEEKRLQEYAEERFALFKKAVKGIQDFQQTNNTTEATEVTESLDGIYRGPLA